MKQTCVICLWIMYLNSPHNMVPGTRNFFFSISGREFFARAFRSTITGTLSGYLLKIRRDSEQRFSKSASCFILRWKTIYETTQTLHDIRVREKKTSEQIYSVVSSNVSTTTSIWPTSRQDSCCGWNNDFRCVLDGKQLPL